MKRNQKLKTASDLHITDDLSPSIFNSYRWCATEILAEMV